MWAAVAGQRFPMASSAPTPFTSWAGERFAALFAGLPARTGRRRPPDDLPCSFNYAGRFHPARATPPLTREPGRVRDDPYARGIRDFEAVDALAQSIGSELVEDLAPCRPTTRCP